MLASRLLGATCCSGLLEHSESEQVKADSTAHLPLDELESVDLPFYLALAPGQLECLLRLHPYP
jgi:hypothetical protein